MFKNEIEAQEKFIIKYANKNYKKQKYHYGALWAFKYAQKKQPLKISLEKFKNDLDGIINDFTNYISSPTEFKNNIIEFMIRVMDKCIENKPNKE